MIYLHQNLKYLRNKFGTSQTFLAEKFGVSQPSYAKWEQSTEPNFIALQKISEWYNIDIDTLLNIDLEQEGIQKKSLRLPTNELQNISDQVKKILIQINDLKDQVLQNAEEIKKLRK